MSADNRRNVAASIVRSMDHVMARMITVFDEPAKETIQADNMGMWLILTSIWYGVPEYLKFINKMKRFMFINHWSPNIF